MSAPRAIILGTNEIASAIAVLLHRAGYGVVLSHDPMPPVIRRRMAFHDVLFDEAIILDGVTARRVEGLLETRHFLRQRDEVLVTPLGLVDLLVLGQLDVLIDARMQKRAITPDFRPLAGVTVGLGPGFAVGRNCDLAIETRPADAGQILQRGATAAADGIPARLGVVGAERFVYSDRPGRWHALVEIGTRVYRGVVLGHLNGVPVAAPLDGVVRGLVRDGSEVPDRVKLLEIDPRGRAAQWSGLDVRAVRLAEATCAALDQHAAPSLSVVQAR